MHVNDFRTLMYEYGFSPAYIQRAIDINEARGGDDWRYLLIAARKTGLSEKEIYAWVSARNIRLIGREQL